MGGNWRAAVNGDELKAAAETFAQELRRKIEDEQGGVATFFNNFLLRTIRELSRLDPALSWEESSRRAGGAEGERLRRGLALLKNQLAARARGRFVAYHERLPVIPEAAPWASDIDQAALAMSQGTTDCLQWRDLPLFKTAFDMSIYPMLIWEQKPRTIVEIGSGSGASALWLADLLAAFGIDGHVHSLDLQPPGIAHPRVTFMAGDCWQIEAAFPADRVAGWPRPWLVIEDAHVNVGGVLDHFHSLLQPDDYLLVEDSLQKRKEISAFTGKYPGAYEVDTRYTDYFGRNATCAFDSIFIRR
jgi:cephalosporin hydroxylase